MIESQRRLIQLARKQPDGSWMFEEINDTAAALFAQTIGFNLPMQEIHNGTGL